MMGDWGGGGWGWGWGFGGIFMILFWALIILGVAALVKWLAAGGGGGEQGGSPASRPMDILKERYARGEITRDQFEQMRRDLGG